MIQGITVKNANAEVFNLSLRDPEGNGGLAITNIDGLTPPKANINLTELSTIDGSVFNSGRISQRNVVITFKLLDMPTIEDVRQTLYRIFPLKSHVEVQIHTDTRDVYTIGYVESNDINVFSEDEKSIVSILCPDPYLYSIEELHSTYSGKGGEFEFPFENYYGTHSISFANITTDPTIVMNYPGETNNGVTFSIFASGNVTDFEIYNVSTEQRMTLDNTKITTITGSGIQSGDIIEICTIKGKKRAQLIREGVTYNIISSLGHGTDWIELINGNNLFHFAGTGLSNVTCEIKTRIMYEGV